MNLIPDLEWNIVAMHIRDLLYAYILALPIGWDREKNERTAGLRTFPLVAVAACGYMLVGLQVLDSSEAHSLEATKAVVILGTIVLGFGGWTLACAVAFFFGVSSFLTIMNGNRRNNPGNAVQISEDRRRDGYQVWANGFWVAIFCTLWFALNSVASLIAAFAALAAATSDTWATEIGTRNPGETRKITTFEEVKAGTEGGISLKGTLGGILGSLLIAIFVFFLGILSPVKFFILIFLGGVAGLFIDSIAGAIFLDENITIAAPEDFSDSTNTFTNSFINWASTGISGLAVYLITQFFIL